MAAVDPKEPQQALPPASGAAAAASGLVCVASSSCGLSLWLLPPKSGLFRYRAGEWVEGRLRAQLSKGTTVYAARAKFGAGARVYWTEHRGESRDVFTEQVRFCHLDMTLQQAAGGTHEWDIRFQLGQGILPGSISLYDSNNYVKYELCCTLETSGLKLMSPKLTYRFDVAATPLPITPSMEQPVEYRSPLLGVYGCCWLTHKGTVTLSLGLPRGSAFPFVDGGKLDSWVLFPITASVNNSHSHMKLGAVIAQLVCKVHRTTATRPGAGGAKEIQLYTVAETEVAPGVGPGQTTGTLSVAFPDLEMRQAGRFDGHTKGVVQCPSFDAGNILRVSYHLVLFIHVGFAGESDPLHAVLPVTFVPTYPEGAAIATLAPQLPSAPMPPPEATEVVMVECGVVPEATAPPEAAVPYESAPAGPGDGALEASEGKLVEPSCPPAL